MKPGSATRLDRLLANLGYGSRKDVARLIRDGRVLQAGEVASDPSAPARHGEVSIDGEPLDPQQGLVVLLNKPAGFTVSTEDPGRVVYDLLPPRYRRRNPILAPVGRLDRDTTGLLLLTDDGDLLHRLISPKSTVEKVYEAVLAQPLDGSEKGRFASGTLTLRGERTPCLPALLEPLGERRARIVLTEGRYHQVRRMFAALGNHVEALARTRFGPVVLGDTPEGGWRALTPRERRALAAAAGRLEPVGKGEPLG